MVSGALVWGIGREANNLDSLNSREKDHLWGEGRGINIGDLIGSSEEIHCLPVNLASRDNKLNYASNWQVFKGLYRYEITIEILGRGEGYEKENNNDVDNDEKHTLYTIQKRTPQKTNLKYAIIAVSKGIVR